MTTEQRPRVHVIEYSAYEESQTLIKQMKYLCEVMRKERDEYKAMCKDSEPLFSQRLVPQLEGRIKLLTQERDEWKASAELRSECATGHSNIAADALGTLAKAIKERDALAAESKELAAEVMRLCELIKGGESLAVARIADKLATANAALEELTFWYYSLRPITEEDANAMWSRARKALGEIG